MGAAVVLQASLSVVAEQHFAAAEEVEDERILHVAEEGQMGQRVEAVRAAGVAGLALQAVAFTCQALGAVAFLNIADYPVNPEREMRAASEQLLDTTAR